MALNPLGAVQVNDFGLPKVIGGYAREVISGGQFVTGSTAAGVVSSGADSFTTSDIKFYVNGSGATVTGIALNTAVSGALVSVAIEGVFILPATGAVSGGQPIAAGGGDAILWSNTAGHIIGRALTETASGGFSVVNLRI